jgi:Xaa-Pro dipeptidase
LGIRAEVADIEFAPATIVEEARQRKSEWELNIIRAAGRICDLGHGAFVEALATGRGERSEVDLIRSAEAVMREANPYYDDSWPTSPSKIASGAAVGSSLLHNPQATRRVHSGSIVNWDICMRYCGYTIDVSRSRKVGEVTCDERRAQDVVAEMFDYVLAAARPGTAVRDLVAATDAIARDAGFRLWEGFLGHGTGLDCQERPVLTIEEPMILEEGMVICIEPRVVLEGRYLIGAEDMVIIGRQDATSTSSFPRFPLGIE